jgi:hypothetical protein
VNTGDQWIAVLVGGAVMLALEVVRRVLDFYMPKGWVSRWAKEHAEKQDDDKESADE